MSGGPHTPVMLDEVMQALAPSPDAIVIDATFGAGGYSRALLDAGARVVAFDRDPAAAQFAGELPADRFQLIQATFATLCDHVDAASAQGAAFDLGVSSMQLDQAERGFSFMRDGPLDMRMGGDGPTAAELVNSQAEADLSRIFWLYGEERASRRIARALVRARASRPFMRTLELADCVEQAVGGRRGAPIHPATRVFQALRIAVNEELAELEAGLAAAEQALAQGGRLAVVTFHSWRTVSSRPSSPNGPGDCHPDRAICRRSEPPRRRPST